MTDKRIYQIGLTMINGVGDILARHLLQALGEAEAVFTEKQQLLGRIPGIGSNIAAEIKRPEILQRAEKELAFIEKNNISCYYLTDTDYPVRLRECPDAPILFYFKGNTNLDATRIISIVGTRNATEYGRELTESLIKDLAKVIPDLLVVSGLAYGTISVPTGTLCTTDFRLLLCWRMAWIVSILPAIGIRLSKCWNRAVC